MAAPRAIESIIASPQMPERQHFFPSRVYSKLDIGDVWGPLWAPRGVRTYGNEVLSVAKAWPQKTGETLDDFVKSLHQLSTIVEKTTVQGGECYPRIWRGTSEAVLDADCGPYVQETPFLGSLIGSIEQFESLCKTLGEIFRIAHPAPDNLKSYGGGIRDLLILACTEVEAQWKGVMSANQYVPTPPSRRLSTVDYVKLLPAMKLDGYGVKLLRYPDIPEIVPFQNWNSTQATQSLVWYNAYNKVKHDREVNFKKATLGRAINALAACVVMLAAQFGERTLARYRLESPFQITRSPRP